MRIVQLIIVGFLFIGVIALTIRDQITQTTETPTVERDIYVSEMEFSTLSDSDNAALQMCRESANIIVHKFALETFDNDGRLRSLGRTAFSECLKLYSLKVVEVD